MLRLFTLCFQRCDQESRSNILNDDLLIDIPGSAYSGPNINRGNEQNQQPEVLGQSSSEPICSGSGDDRRVVVLVDCEKSCLELKNPYDPVESDYYSEKTGGLTVGRGGFIEE